MGSYVTILDRIVARKHEEVAQRRRALPLAAFRDAAPLPPRDFAAALRQPGVSVIAEIKRRSPSRGVLREKLDPAELAECYERHGASAISVLTDHDFFGGSDEDLRAARKTSGLPILRKDFTVDEYQIHESRALGASAVLLIVRLLSTQQLREYRQCAGENGLQALVEVHALGELDRALDGGATIVGINARDLDTFETDLPAALETRKACPADILTVAESAIRDRADVQLVEKAGFDAILVGETLVRAADPGAKLRELLGGESEPRNASHCRDARARGARSERIS